MDFLIHKLGGYTKNDVLTEVVRDLFNTIDETDILQDKDGKVIFQGRPLANAQVELIRNEAKMFTNTMLWKVLQTDIKWKANETMFLKAKTGEDLIAGKLWIYTLECLKKRLDTLGNSAS